MRVAVFATLFIMLNFSAVAGQRGAQGDGLSVNLRDLTNQHSYAMKDSIALQFEVINLTHEPIGVFAKLGMGSQGGLIIHVLDSTGAEVQSPNPGHDFIYLDAVQDVSNYFALQPYMFFGTKQEYTVSQLVSKPGHYRLLGEYHCPVDSKYAKAANFWGIDRKSVVSSEIEFNVQ